jgi:eukaryotic-like serine/threonine-protein kinase
MNEKPENPLPIEKLALDKKLISQQQLDQCQELVRKSKKIGLQTTVEEILVKQAFLSAEQVHELKEIGTLTGDGKFFGPYQLGKLIGEGGMGKVYEAVHEFMGRSVAVKVINATLTSDKTNASRFFQEIRALAKLNHPNIVSIYDAGRIDKRYYFTMERLPGPSLKDYTDSKKMLDEKEALGIISGIARGLGHAHAKGVVHRDVKPENILFDARGVATITDFGLVMHHDDDHMSLTQEGFMVGSFYYSAPEQVEGSRDIDGRSDIYSLGATLYYALTGRTVYSGTSAKDVLTQHLAGNMVSPKRFNPKISGHTVQIVKKMMAVEREKRFQSMESVIAAIEQPILALRIWHIGQAVLLGMGLALMGMLIERFFPVFDKLLK